MGRPKKRQIEDLPNGYLVKSGEWLPISIAAMRRGCSSQHLYGLIKARRLRAIKYPQGPALVRMEDVPLVAVYNKVKKEGENV